MDNHEESAMLDGPSNPWILPRKTKYKKHAMLLRSKKVIEPEAGNKDTVPQLPHSTMDTRRPTENEPESEPLTTFTRFPDLPLEIHLRIIGIAADEAYHSSSGVVRIHPGDKEATFYQAGLSSDGKRTFCMVNHLFKSEYIRRHPLSFAIYRHGKEIFPASVPFNYDTDRLVVPQELLEIPSYYDIPDFKKVKRVIILWRRNGMHKNAVERLMDMPPSAYTERKGGYIGMMHEPSFRPEHLASLTKYGTFTGPFSEEEKRACNSLAMRLVHHPRHDWTFSYGLAVWSLRLRFDLMNNSLQTPPEKPKRVKAGKGLTRADLKLLPSQEHDPREQINVRIDEYLNI